MHLYQVAVLMLVCAWQTLPLDRIHNMLKMFVDPPYTKKIQVC